MKRAEKKVLTLETRRRDLTAATLVSIRKHGYMNSTINTISEESGLSRGLISHYFKNKDDLILFAFRYLTELLEDFHRQVVRAWGGVTHFEKLLASAMVPFLRDQHREVWLHFWSASRLQPEVAEVHRTLWGRYRASVERRITAVAEEHGLTLNIRSTTLMYTQLIDGLWIGLVLENAYDEATCRMILRDWLCDVFRQDPEKHPADPPFDLASIQSPLTV
ncbi:TetR family transcriptional regulator C-terminal domain-containing protein [Rhizobium sp. RAF56]|jgi:TetR/AcrR family transcriptional repressor of bet genes|uniref:TetR family transcriptional regulator C-terminal domain-containing protein n=1 Tax=Rhizobium sp. RAF56 TaxID=3233062 RepID=UPI003F9E8E74